VRFNVIVRSHWGIEKQPHWVLDVVMDEDQARNCKDHGPHISDANCRQKTESLFTNTFKLILQQNLPQADIC
jgi:predicted transposase YbfD/YdcC